MVQPDAPPPVAQSTNEISSQSRTGAAVKSMTMDALLPARTTEMRIDDLSEDRLLSMALKMNVDGRMVPSLGGIPLLHRLGVGGMGSVYYGIHPRLQLEVAVKVMSFSLAERNQEWVQRFYREGRMAAMLKSPNVVHVHDVNEEGGLFYMVMDLVKGISAHSYQQRAIDVVSDLSELECLDICIAATRGLAVAHENGIIHRDIKPDNILIPFADDNRTLTCSAARLTDLGLARFEGGSDMLTATETMMGTVGFMAPEQARSSKRASKSSDVFSMGATLYALLCGEVPFTGSTPLDTLMTMMEKPHVPLESRRDGLSAATIRTVNKCLEKDPANRFPSAVELLSALEACRTGVGAPARL
jgi:eukaryotic-like serine/threonine-protein kinase